MPIDFQVDHQRRIVFAWGRGTLTDQEVFGYQQEVWSLPDVAGYDELVDMTDVEQIALPASTRVEDLARLAARMDSGSGESRVAIVAPSDIAYGLGRMYQRLRELQVRSTRQVGVFRTLPEALRFLGIEGVPPRPGSDRL